MSTLSSAPSSNIPNSPSKSNCQICSMNNPQIKSLISHLMDTLRNLLLTPKPQNNVDSGGFLQLVRKIFYTRCRNFRDTMQCKHFMTRDVFMGELGIDLLTLNNISNQKNMALSKFNFHLDVMSMQGKSFHRHFSYPRQQSQKMKSSKFEIAEMADFPKKMESRRNKNFIKQQHVSLGTAFKNQPLSLDMRAHGHYGFQSFLQFEGNFSQVMKNMIMGYEYSGYMF